MAQQSIGSDAGRKSTLDLSMGGQNDNYFKDGEDSNGGDGGMGTNDPLQLTAVISIALELLIMAR